jgi:hypothetical protein
MSGAICFLLGMLIGGKTNGNGSNGMSSEKIDRLLSIVRWALERKLGSFPPRDNEHTEEELRELLADLQNKKGGKK